MWDFPWVKKVDKASVVQTFKQISDLVKIYEKYEFGTKYLVPLKVHDTIIKAAKGIKKVEDFQAYYKDMEAVYTALAVLNKQKTVNNTEIAAKAYGQLFVAVSVVVGKLPSPANAYSGPLKIIGENFVGIVRTLNTSTHGSEGLEDDYRDFLGGGSTFINGR